MRSPFHYRLLIFSFVLIFFAGFSFLAHADTTITSNVSSNTTWDTSGSVYIIQNSISINSGVTLTIEPGVVVKFKSGVALTVSGTLDAQGTSTSTIYFTSFKDDAVGGDTNNDGSATTPAAGNWDTIQFNSGSVGTISHAVVRYGGSTYPIFFTYGGNLTVSNSEVATSSSQVIYNYTGTTTVISSVIHHGTYGVYQNNGYVHVDSSTIRDNTNYGIDSNDSGSIFVENSTLNGNTTAAGRFILTYGLVASSTNNSASGNGKNGFIITGGMANNQTWAADIPYILQGFSIGSGKTLTLKPGVIVKFDGTSAGLTVNGTLQALGNPEVNIFFTSLKDDSIGGDTNNDGSATTPAAGNWDTIQFNSGSTGTLSHTVVRYGGYTYPMLLNYGGDLEFINSEAATSSTQILQTSTGTTTITYSYLHNGTYGLYQNDGVISVASSTIENFTSYGAFNSSGANINALNNYWGSSSGPYHATSNPSGNQNSKVSNNVDFNPWVGGPHYVLGYSSVNQNTNEIRYIASTQYASAWYSAVDTWNAQNQINVATDTVDTTADLGVTDAYEPSEYWDGLYCYYDCEDFGGIDVIYLNSYPFSNYTSNQRQFVATHELGHALGLDHSYDGNIMHAGVTSQTSLGSQDVSDYAYLYP
ncbi:matrixin family metalloprotease [Candidatus Giovannonibacteria bacterium]|nr:matrixin family metalloprotease [Candidatus Giovannonibacteria bacterium]